MSNWQWALNAGELLLELFHSKHTNLISEYEPKVKTLLMLEKLLATPFPGGSAYDRLLGNIAKNDQKSEYNLTELNIGINKLYSEEVNTRYSEINAILEEWRNVNCDINELFQLIEDGQPEQFEVIKEEIEKEIYNDDYYSNDLNKLEIWPIDYYGVEPSLKQLNYRDLETKFNIFAQQYRAAVEAIIEKMKDEITN